MSNLTEGPLRTETITTQIDISVPSPPKIYRHS